MPCYLFTLHAYGSWMPDRKRGFVHRGEGVLPASEKLAAVYRKAQTESTIAFDEACQRVIIDALIEATSVLSVRLHYVATDPTHVHMLVSWKTDQDWKSIRRSLRSSISRRLNKAQGVRTWLAKSGSRKRVADRQHFDHLVNTYLPNHRGLKWSEQQGFSDENSTARRTER